MKKLLTSSALAALAVMAATSMSYAANMTGQGEDNMITVTATRTEQLVKNVPGDTYIVTQQQIQNRQYKNLAEAIKGVPGVNLGFDPHGGLTVSIRGADPRHTLILVNGVRTNTSLSSFRANSATFNRIPMDDVQRIEVLEGASSALYGADAIGGVINIITKTAAQGGGSINLEADIRDKDSRYMGYVTTLSLHTGQQGKLSANLDISKNRMSEAYMNGVDSQPTGVRTPIHFMATYAFNKDNKLSYTFDYEKEDLEQVGVGGRPGVAAQRKATTRNSSLQFKGKLDTTEVSLLGYKNHYGDFTYDSVMPMPAIPHYRPAVVPRTKIATFPGYFYDGWDTVTFDRQGLELQFDTPLTDAHLLTYGVQLRKDTVEGTRIKSKDIVVDQGDVMGVPNSVYRAHRNSQSYFLQDMWQVNDNLTIVPALRYDNHSVLGSRFSPKLGITYHVDKTMRFKANVGAGYAIPNFFELYADWSHGGAFKFIGNPNLKPEHSFNVDFAVEKDFLNGSVKIGGFYNDIKDFINFKAQWSHMPPMGPPDRLTWQNVDHARMQGGYISTTWTPTPGFDIFGSATIVNTKDVKSNEPLQYRPRLNYTAGINLYNDQWNLSFWGTYSGQIWDGNTYSHSSNWNVLATYKLDQQTKVYAGVNNLFGTDSFLVSQDGPVYRMGVEMKF